MNIFRYPQRVLARRRDNKMMPKNPRHDDFYVVEFPKSGITWLTAILANVALIESGRKEIASYTTACNVQ
jgi:hypothetical protein